MIEKLKLNHLTPYLPHKLRVMHGGKDKVMNIGRGSSMHWIGISAVIKWQNVKAGCKPILNQLTEEIVRKIFNGLTVRKIELHEIYCRVEWETMGERFITWVKANGSFDNCPHWIMERLYENHVDIFGLIDNGLAYSSDEIKANG